MNQSSFGNWPQSILDFKKNIVLTGFEETEIFENFPQQIIAFSEGWTNGPIAVILRGGINATAVLELLAASGIKEITIYHIEEKIAQLEEIFLSTVVSEANRLFDKTQIIWRHDSSIFELVKSFGDKFQSLFLGAPLVKSEIVPFYQRIKQDFPGKVTIVRGSMTEVEFDSGDEIYRWVRERTFEASDFAISAVLQNYKKKLQVKIAVLLPSLNEEKTVAKVIETALEVKNVGILDEVILVDSASSDRTVDIARNYGIPIYQHHQIRSELGSHRGKGEAMFKSAYITDADIIAWVDTDIENITPTFFYGLLGPMLANPKIRFVKGYFARPIRVEAGGIELGGGRVTEILARPWINTFMPELSGFIQPLAGTVAIYRDLFQKMSIPTNYGVEIAMLIQAVQSEGIWSTCQVNLGEVIHKSKDVIGLSEMAFQILQVLANLPGSNQSAISNHVLRHIFNTQGHFEISMKKFPIQWRSFIPFSNE